MQEPKWIEWYAGERPVSGDTPVEVRYRNGSTEMRNARKLGWAISGGDFDIVAYRVVGDIESALAIITAAGGIVTFPEPKKRMVRITIDVPEPMTEAPELDDDYWYVDLACFEIQITGWESLDEEHALLAAGLCYATEADAQAALDAWAKRTVTPLMSCTQGEPS